MAGPLTRVAAFVARFDFMYPMSCLLTFCGRKVVHIEPEGGPYRGPPGAHKLARKYLCAPLGSVASERVSKLSKRTVEHRYNLKAENVEMLIFMKYNLRYLNFRY